MAKRHRERTMRAPLASVSKRKLRNAEKHFEQQPKNKVAERAVARLQKRLDNSVESYSNDFMVRTLGE